MQYSQTNNTSANGQSKGREKQDKIYTRIKHSMLIFTSLSVDKNNSFCSSEGQKIYSLRINMNRTKVYVWIKQLMLMFNSKSVNKNFLMGLFVIQKF